MSSIVAVNTDNTNTVISNTVSTPVLETVQTSVVTNNKTGNIVVEIPSISVITAGLIGPKGDTGVSEDDMAYAKQTDFFNDTVIYKGEAAVGSLTSSPAWRIRKLVLAVDDDVSETWASGNANFDKVWDNRTSLTYI